MELLLRIQRRRNDQKVKQEGEEGEEVVIEEPRDDCESAPRSLCVWRGAGSSKGRAGTVPLLLPPSPAMALPSVPSSAQAPKRGQD